MNYKSIFSFDFSLSLFIIGKMGSVSDIAQTKWVPKQKKR